MIRQDLTMNVIWWSDIQLLFEGWDWMLHLRFTVMVILYICLDGKTAISVSSNTVILN